MSENKNDSYRMAWVRSGLRGMWLKWPPRHEVIADAKIPAPPGGRFKNFYVCAICTKGFPRKEVEVDHYPVACGSLKSVNDLPSFVDNLFCSKDNLRVVCKRCHVMHTNGYTEVDMLVAEFARKPVAEQRKVVYSIGGTEDDVKNAATRSAFYRKHVSLQK